MLDRENDSHSQLVSKEKAQKGQLLLRNVRRDQADPAELLEVPAPDSVKWLLGNPTRFGFEGRDQGRVQSDPTDSRGSIFLDVVQDHGTLGEKLFKLLFLHIYFPFRCCILARLADTASYKFVMF